MNRILHCQCGNLLSSTDRYCSQCGIVSPTKDNPERVLNFGTCPDCENFSLSVSKTMKPFRVIRCNECLKKFKTVEVFMYGGIENEIEVLAALKKAKAII